VNIRLFKDGGEIDLGETLLSGGNTGPAGDNGFPPWKLAPGRTKVVA
jgi:hypothetical protein